MAGARKRASPALTATERSKTRRWLRWPVLILMIAATPFCWLVARDAILVLRASDGNGAETAHWLLVTRLANTIDDAGLSVRTREPFYLTMVFDPSCFVLRAEALQPSDTPAEKSSFRDAREPSLNEILSTHRMLAERTINQNIQHGVISESFSTPELILFNACIAATPLGGTCKKRVSTRINALYDKTAEKTFRVFGTKAKQAGTPDRYCDIMPDVMKRPAQ